MNIQDDNEYREIWNDIVFDIDKHKAKNEEALQMLLETGILPKLNWRMSRGEVLRPTKKVGSSKFIKPDAILSKDGYELIVIELKQGFIELNAGCEEQLFSYMREFKLKFGILWGKSLRLFYDEILDKEPPQKICEISFNKDNPSGIELIKLLDKNNFDENIFQKYCIDCLKKLEIKKEIDKNLNYLCSSAGVEYIKQLLSTEYPPEVIDRLDIKITDKNKRNIQPPTTKPQPYPSQIPQIIDKDFERRPNETVQDWLKRILMQLFRNNMLTEEEIKNLHDKVYSKRATGMNYKLLFDTREESFIAGLYRSWKTPIYGYYICSQLTNTPYYENLIVNWLNKILEENKNNLGEQK